MNKHELSIIVQSIDLKKLAPSTPALKASWMTTLLGEMLAIADNNALYFLEFIDCKGLDREIKRLVEKTKRTIIPGKTAPIISIESEIELYFKGELQQFTTPLVLLGTPFQNQVWQELRKIPFGTTRSYLEIAQALGNPKAFRAVALTNSVNQLAIIVPCHRVINSDGKIGGYSGGLFRKEWFLLHEKGKQ